LTIPTPGLKNLGISRKFVSIIEFKDFLLENGATIMKDVKETPTGLNMIVKHFDGMTVEYVEQQK
jgi:hypothetical protein